MSIARLHDDELVYEAADGAGGDAITGVRLPTSRGIAGYVARTGQSLVVDQVQSDPRFARDVAERVGYLPTSLIVVPVVDDDELSSDVSRADSHATPTIAPSTTSTAATQIGRAHV